MEHRVRLMIVTYYLSTKRSPPEWPPSSFASNTVDVTEPAAVPPSVVASGTIVNVVGASSCARLPTTVDPAALIGRPSDCCCSQ